MRGGMETREIRINFCLLLKMERTDEGDLKRKGIKFSIYLLLKMERADEGGV
jgi:hypothetical protein